MKRIYFAGGCFWGVEAYFQKIPGVIDTTVGYANGKTENPSYEEVCTQGTDHAETVKIEYDETKISLNTLLRHLFRIIDPYSVNRQGNDQGRQYRTGVYTENEEDRALVDEFLKQEQAHRPEKIAVESLPLEQFSRRNPIIRIIYKKILAATAMLT